MLTALGLAVSEEARPGSMIVLFWKETDVEANTIAAGRRRRSGLTSRTTDRRIFDPYVTVTVKEGPVPADVPLPAQTVIVIGVEVTVCAARVVGTPEGAAHVRVLAVDGHTPLAIPVPEAVTLGVSAEVPWLSMQKNAWAAGPP